LSHARVVLINLPSTLSSYKYSWRGENISSS